MVTVLEGEPLRCACDEERNVACIIQVPDKRRGSRFIIALPEPSIGSRPSDVLSFAKVSERWNISSWHLILKETVSIKSEASRESNQGL